MNAWGFGPGLNAAPPGGNGHKPVEMQGEVMGYKESGIEEYQFLGGTEHSGSCTCSELNGRVFRVDEAEPGVNLPPIHPNCLCIIRAYFKKSVFAKREGNPLDGNIKFEEWKKKYAS